MYSCNVSLKIFKHLYSYNISSYRYKSHKAPQNESSFTSLYIFLTILILNTIVVLTLTMSARHHQTGI